VLKRPGKKSLHFKYVLEKSYLHKYNTMNTAINSGCRICTHSCTLDRGLRHQLLAVATLYMLVFT
jgi:hypothetical protein